MALEQKPRTVLLSVNVPGALAEQLDAFCVETGINRTGITRLALRAFLANVPRTQQEK